MADELRALERVESGGEKHLKFARGRLAALAAARKDLRLPSLQKHFKIGSSLVRMKSTDWGDLIYITAGGGPWNFYFLTTKATIPGTDAQVAALAAAFGLTIPQLLAALGLSTVEQLKELLGTGVVRRLHVGDIGGATSVATASTVLDAGAGSLTVSSSRSVDAPHLIVRQDNTWRVVDPDRKTIYVSDGLFDGLTIHSFVAGNSWALSLNEGSGFRLLTKDTSIAIPARSSTNNVLRPTEDAAYFVRSRTTSVVDGLPGIQIYKAGVIAPQEVRTDWDVAWPPGVNFDTSVPKSSTRRDCLVLWWGEATGTILSGGGASLEANRLAAPTHVYSYVLNREVGFVSQGYSLLDTPDNDSTNRETANATDLFVMGLRGSRGTTSGSLVDDPLSNHTFCTVRAAAQFSEAGELTDYVVSSLDTVIVGPSVADEFTNFRAAGPLPLKNGAWLPFVLRDSYHDPLEFEYWSLRSDGTTFSFRSPIVANTFDSFTREFRASVGDDMWTILLNGQTGISSTLQFWRQGFKVFESAAFVPNNTLRVAGATASTVYMHCPIAGSSRLIGSDGTDFRVHDYLPATAGLVQSFQATQDTIYGFGSHSTGKIYHITDLKAAAEGPPVPGVKTYPYDGALVLTVPSVAIPDPSYILRGQELEAWPAP